MKSSSNRQAKPERQQVAHNQKPEIRDNLDSRKNEEQDFKGDDVTHNKKDKQSSRAGKQNKK